MIITGSFGLKDNCQVCDVLTVWRLLIRGKKKKKHRFSGSNWELSFLNCEFEFSMKRQVKNLGRNYGSECEFQTKSNTTNPNLETD